MTTLEAAAGAPALDTGEQRRARRRRARRIGRWLLPAVVVMLSILGWDWLVRAYEIPHYILPGPGRVWAALIEDWPILSQVILYRLWC